MNVIKAKNIKPYYYESVTKYIYLESVDEESIIEKNYPNFFNKLQQYKDSLNNRYQYNRVIPYWKWVFLRNLKLFSSEQDRILVPCKERISNKNYFRFAFAEKGIFLTQDVTAIFKKENTKESIYYILALLNNHRVFQWLVHNGIVKGNIVEFSERPISSIPFRKIDWTNPIEIKLHDNIRKISG